jgi:hypothetical protein
MPLPEHGMIDSAPGEIIDSPRLSANVRKRRSA